ncbi:MAG TPA: sigma-70 family RNA polymerase sigma factor [Clostridia bacterium]|nr:sigma-70 family RNA polymerase sigma factor [Clostridia bacterium]
MIETSIELSECYLKFQRRLFRAALSYLNGNRYEATDVVEDVILKLLERSPVFENEAACLVYMLRIVHSLAKDKFKPNVDSVLKHPVDIDDIKEAYMGEVYQQDHSQRDFELQSMIKAKLKNQPEEMQEIFIRHVIDDISIVDLAKLYNMDYAALRKRIYRIKTQLSVSVKVDEVIWTLILISNVPFLLQLTFFSRR